MDSEGGLTFLNSGNNTVKSSKAGIFSRNVTHSTKIPNFKLWLNITSFGKVIKRKILKFGAGSSRFILREKISPFVTVRSRDRFTCNGGGCTRLTARNGS